MCARRPRRPKQLMNRRTARLPRYAGRGHPEHGYLAHDIVVDVADLEVLVRSPGRSIEDDVRVFGWIELGEGDRCGQVGVGADPGDVDAERVLERVADVAAERIVADSSDGGGSVSESRRCHRHVRGGATE